MLRFALPLLIALVGCSSPPRVLSESVDRDFVGEIELGEPEIRRKYVRIPVRFSGGELVQREDVAIERLDCAVAGNVIQFTVVIGPRRREELSLLPVILLAGLEPGEYQVYYENPGAGREKVGAVVIPETRGRSSR